MSDRRKAAFDAAGEAVKQLITLGTGAIGGIIALFDNGEKIGVDLGEGWAVYVSLACLALSVVSGMFALGALAGQLGNAKIRRPTTYALGVLVFSQSQMYFFGTAIVLLVAAVVFHI